MRAVEMTAPSYYEAFRCLAEACRDNCCRTGWEIVVDQATLDAYRGLPQPQRDRILSGIGQDEEGDWCILPREGQCPFLNEQGLCSLVLELGEDYIGDICALHPRYREWFPGRMEIGVGLCCEEAARLILSDPAPAEFVTYLTDGDPDDEDSEKVPLYLPLLEVRDRLFALAQDRSLPLARRMAGMLRLALGAQKAINQGTLPSGSLEPENMPSEPRNWQPVLAALLHTHGEMEYLDQGWMDQVTTLAAHLPELDWEGFRSALGKRGYEYEHLLVYLLFRYSLKGAFDGRFLLRVQMGVAMTLTMAALGAWQWQQTGHFSLADQIEVTRQYSKEVEYSDDNMAALEEGLIFEPDLSLPGLLGLLES